jgi:CHASE2 domain
VPRWRSRTTLRGAAKRTTKVGWLERMVKDYLHHLPSAFYVAWVVASIIHILNELDLPLELPATMLLANVAELYVPAPPKSNDVRRHLAVVEIDGERHRRQYGGTSPLDRCQLTSDLKKLLQNTNVRVLAIDFDLSPVDAASYQEEWARVSSQRPGDNSAVSRPPCQAMQTTQAQCQCELERVLVEPANHKRIITIAPLTPTEGRTKGTPWDNPKDFPDVEFGDPVLNVRFGMVHDYEYPPPGYVGSLRLPLAELIARRLCSDTELRYEAPRSLWTPVLAWVADKTGLPLPVPANRCDDVSPPQRPESNHPSHRQDDRKFIKHPISFFETRHLHDGGRPVAFDDLCLREPVPYRSETRQQPCDIRLVIFGGSYGVEDRYLTALGKISGVQTHAVVAAQLRAHTWHGWGYLIDIALGCVLFGPFVHWTWRRYFLQSAQASTRSGAPRGPREVAYLWLVLLSVGLVGLVALLVVGSAYAYAYTGIWISPVPMALGMLVEAMVSGSVHVATSVIHEVDSTAHGAAPTTTKPTALKSTKRQPEKVAAAVIGKLPTAAAIGLILYAVYELFHSLGVAR